MHTWSGIEIISTMRSTRTWDCRLGVGWSRVRVSGSSNSASREWGCAGVKSDLTICYISDSPGSTARLRRCFRYSYNHPPTRNYTRVSVNSRHDKNKKDKGRLLCIILMNQALHLTLISLTLGKSLALLSKFLHENVDA